MRLTIAGHNVLSLLRRTAGEIFNDNILGFASQTAWSMFFGVFPLLLIAAPLLSLVGDRRALVQAILDRVAPSLPPTSYALISGVVRDVVFTRNAPGLISVGALLSVWSGSAVFSSLMTALNAAFDTHETRPWWRVQLIAIVSAAASIVIVWASTTVLVAGQTVVAFVAHLLGLGPVGATIWTLLQYPLAMLLVVLLIWLLYLVLPDLPDSEHAPTRRATFVGALVATVLWLLVTTVFRLYVTHFNAYNRTYGTIGGVIILLTWMYWTMFCILAGGELASEIRADRPLTADAARSAAARSAQIRSAADAVADPHGQRNTPRPPTVPR